MKFLLLGSFNIPRRQVSVLYKGPIVYLLRIRGSRWAIRSIHKGKSYYMWIRGPHYHRYLAASAMAQKQCLFISKVFYKFNNSLNVIGSCKKFNISRTVPCARWIK